MSHCWYLFGCYHIVGVFLDVTILLVSLWMSQLCWHLFFNLFGCHPIVGIFVDVPELLLSFWMSPHSRYLSGCHRIVGILLDVTALLVSIWMSLHCWYLFADKETPKSVSLRQPIHLHIAEALLMTLFLHYVLQV